MLDSITEVSSLGWLGRIRESIKGLLFGLLLFVVSFPILWFNEKNSAETIAGLNQLLTETVTVDSGTVNSEFEGRPVHMQGRAETGDVLRDTRFGVTANAIKLIREVEMFQWEETEKTTKRKKIGGGEETVTTYEYERVWSKSPINSAYFNEEGIQGHENPPMPYQSETLLARDVSLGGFKLSAFLFEQMNDREPLVLGNEQRQNLPPEMRAKLRDDGPGYYQGNPGAPQIGDLRIQFHTVEPAMVSIIAQQTGNTFEKFVAKNGKTFGLLEMGQRDKENVIQVAQDRNRIFTWMMRLVGTGAMFFGIILLLRPFSVLADVVPILGDMMGVGIGFIAALIAAGGSLMTIAVAWIYYRPLLGIPLALLSIGSMVFIFMKLQAQRKVRQGNRNLLGDESDVSVTTSESSAPVDESTPEMSQSANTLKVSCPHCQQHIACDAEYAGHQIACPSCSEMMFLSKDRGSTKLTIPRLVGVSLLLGLLAALGLAVFGGFPPEVSKFKVSVGVFLIVSGVMMAFLAGLMILINALHKSVWWGLGFFVPLLGGIVAVTFVVRNWARNGRFFLTNLGGTTLAAGGLALVFITAFQDLGLSLSEHAAADDNFMAMFSIPSASDEDFAVSETALEDVDELAAEEREPSPRTQSSLAVASPLHVDGSSVWLELSPITWESLEAFTIEAWVKDWSGTILAQGNSGDPENSIHMGIGPRPRSGSGYSSSGWEFDQGRNAHFTVKQPVDTNWMHVAMVFDGRVQSFFVNGRRKHHTITKKPGVMMKNRALRVGNGGQGWLGEIRVSMVARYQEDFEPAPSWNTDAQTLILLQREHRESKVWRDSSGRGRDAKIHGAVPVLAQHSGPPPLVFDGKKDWLQMAPIEWDKLKAFTVEAWLQDWQGIILNQGQGGDPANSLWLAFGPKGSRDPFHSSGWEFGRGKNSQFALGIPPSNRWVHVAMVYDRTNQVFYLDGKVTRRAKAPGPGFIDPVHPLTIGIAAASKNRVSHGQGKLRAVRISSSVRYGANFSPDAAWETDDQTLLLLESGHQDGNVWPDLSGHERHARIHGNVASLEN